MLATIFDKIVHIVILTLKWSWEIIDYVGSHV